MSLKPAVFSATVYTNLISLVFARCHRYNQSCAY